MNFYEEDHHFQSLIKKLLRPALSEWAERELHEFGERCATVIDERARHTDREGQPKLVKYDRFGEDISEVWVNDGYKQTIKETYDKGIVGYIHKSIPEIGEKGDYVYSYAQGYLLSQTEPGFYCPVTLTMATAYLLEHYASTELKARFLPHVLSTGEMELYEGATFLTERQGGSDVGANETKAVKDGENYRLYGEKYFASNAGMCGVAMVLARTEGAAAGSKGLSLFAVSWRKENGSLNGIAIRRLKDKLGVRAVPSAEVEFTGAEAFLVGEECNGIYYMMEALNLSRVCNAIASIGIMRRAFSEAKSYAFRREAFGRKLADYPMVKDTLTRLAVKQEVDTSAVFTLVELFDKVMKKDSKATAEETALNRLLIALLKMETAEQSIHFAHEAIEMHGGNGFIEDFVTPRLLRDAQVLTVWEGTANILGLEVLRLMHKFKVHHLFMDHMKKEISELPAALVEWKDLLHDKVEALSDMTAYVMNSPEETQTFHSKKIAKLMTNVYESVIVLKEAAVGTQRDLHKAEIFLEQTWEITKYTDESMKTVKFFEEIICWEINESKSIAQT
ncbi:acyl-CoA dehydrogenase family protein [Falsibacillus albus]|uniref:Isovaleryl-CoA dehydrogenase n=1 Tax=Falsibacillus albus TaxID=2478915 RepID=A0A3L7JUA0_9BACI|nr:acyl-CoA dehydrogenase family protein [Falsibacillus albus]RLQ94090.1 isovaleryl-CoA dehydrogenase [Falsibacillus albus]